MYRSIYLDFPGVCYYILRFIHHFFLGEVIIMIRKDEPSWKGAGWHVVAILFFIGLICVMLLIATPAQSITEATLASIENIVGQKVEVADTADSSLDVYLTKMHVNNTVERTEELDGLLEFYSTYTRSSVIAKTILEESLRCDIPIHIAFSLAWRESRFYPQAVSSPNKRGTRDWGLFQLNDGNRKSWTRGDFFNVEKNTRHGLSFLKYCIEQMGSLELGLAAYNAGIYGVRSKGVPSSTQRYIKDIFAYEAELDSALNRFFESDSSDSGRSG
jgi:hypothetical protein